MTNFTCLDLTMYPCIKVKWEGLVKMTSSALVIDPRDLGCGNFYKIIDCNSFGW